MLFNLFEEIKYYVTNVAILVKEKEETLICFFDENKEIKINKSNEEYDGLCRITLTLKEEAPNRNKIKTFLQHFHSKQYDSYLDSWKLKKLKNEETKNSNEIYVAI